MIPRPAKFNGWLFLGALNALISVAAGAYGRHGALDPAGRDARVARDRGSAARAHGAHRRVRRQRRRPDPGHVDAADRHRRLDGVGARPRGEGARGARRAAGTPGTSRARGASFLVSALIVRLGVRERPAPDAVASLKSAGFNGPIMVECCQIGATLQETTANAKANRIFLEQALGEV